MPIIKRNKFFLIIILLLTFSVCALAQQGHIERVAPTKQTIDSILSVMQTTPCWRVVEAYKYGQRYDYIGGKIIFPYKEILFHFSNYATILYENYDTQDRGIGCFLTQEECSYSASDIAHFSDSLLIIKDISFPNGDSRRNIYRYALAPASKRDLEELKSKYQRRQNTHTANKVVSIYQQDLPLEFLSAKEKERLLLEAIIRENGLDRELALKCYYMNIQRDMSFHPKISNAVAYPPSQPIATMRAEQIEAKPSLRKSRNR